MSLPLNLDPWVVYYNKELFDAKRIAFPETFAEMVDAAAKLNDPAKGVSGFVGRGLKNANVPGLDEFPARLWRRLHRQERQAAYRYPRGDRCSEDVPDAAREVRPARRRGLQLERIAKPLLQGKAAMWLDGIGFAQPLEDPTKSRIVGKVGYGVMPAGPKQRFGAVCRRQGHLDLQQEKGAVMVLLQWASNKANQTRMLQAAAGAPVRASAYARRRRRATSSHPRSGSNACSLRRRSRSPACR